MDSPDGSKAALRAGLLAARRARPADELARARAGIRALVIARFGGARVVAGYEPLRTEPGSVELLAAFAELGARVIVPVTLPDRDLDWTIWDGPGAPLGVDAISEADVVVVPALAVAADGTRLGRGGGSYDRALARVPAGVPTVALVFEGEVLPALPRDDWDVPVGAAATPTGWVRLGGNADFPPER